MFAFAAFVSGLVFGLGLVISGMINPAKILGFLDLAGRWDPTLALVMIGAIAVGVIAFRVAGRRTESLLHAPMPLPISAVIDARLVGGSVLFGAGWGLAGFCPGPALAALGTALVKAVVFVGAMLAGMLVFEGLERIRAQ
ncbi:MAG: DUF6691 family protein [Betaproteobacteria bacterium]